MNRGRTPATLVLLGALAVLGVRSIRGAEPAVAESVDLERVREYRERHGAAILADYASLLAIPNTPAHPEGLRRTAETIVDALGRRGVEAGLLELDGAPPVVWGRLDVPGATRTLGIYVHYDGQPVDPSQWSYPPFEPTLTTAALDAGGVPRPFPAPGEPIDPEWRIYARSSGDDKVPLPAIFAALDALAEQSLTPTSNLLFFFEGEEERGSPHLEAFFRKYRERLDADLWLICDGPVHQSRRPQLVFGVRGYSGVEITVYGAERYLHSGHYGNWAPNPAMMLAQLLASMKDAEGRVSIEGFNDSTTPLSARERAALEAVPDPDEALMRELGLARVEGGGATLAERLTLPSLNVRGLVSASVGQTARNLVPTEATASIDIRLVHDNDPEGMLDLVERHIRGQGYHIVRDEPDHATRLAHPRVARVVRQPSYRAVRTSMDLPVVRPVIEAAGRAAGEAVILLPTLGGSLPLYLFTELLGRPIVVVPIANHDDNQHAPDENIRIANLWYGIDLYAELFTMP